MIANYNRKLRYIQKKNRCRLIKQWWKNNKTPEFGKAIGEGGIYNELVKNGTKSLRQFQHKYLQNVSMVKKFHKNGEQLTLPLYIKTEINQVVVTIIAYQ